MRLRARQFEFTFPRPALVMGILNVTPDSFSDGGRFLDPQAAVDRALRLVEEGADIIDVGGESTRPGAAPVNEGEELRRVMPVLERLAGQLRVPISIDTQKPGVARPALSTGVAIVNDVAANRSDPELWRVVAESGAAYVAMHMQGTPQTMQVRPQYDDVVADVERFFEDRLKRLADAGVGAEQIILDVGIGFGKTVEHNLELLAHLKGFRRFRRPTLLGVSRKSFLSKLLGEESDLRLPAGLACTCWAVQCGVEIFRTHDVRETRQAIRMTEAILARSQ